jgi:isocitrate dehydrogenase
LTEGKSPLRKAGQLDNRGSHFYLALYWAEALVNQNDDQELVVKFKPLFESLSANESKIMAEIDSTQGKAIDIGGYYYPDDALLTQAMCPSATFNEIIAAG